MGKLIDADASAVSALAAQVRVSDNPVVVLPPQFNWDESRAVTQLRQSAIFDASELLFIGLCSELEPKNV